MALAAAKVEGRVTVLDFEPWRLNCSYLVFWRLKLVTEKQQKKRTCVLSFSDHFCSMFEIRPAPGEDMEKPHSDLSSQNTFRVLRHQANL